MLNVECVVIEENVMCLASNGIRECLKVVHAFARERRVLRLTASPRSSFRTLHTMAHD
jgi:hypothetical protein